jgi:hypothetical protein
MVDRRVLIPRYETELMVQIGLGRAGRVAEPRGRHRHGFRAIALSFAHR